MSYPARAEGLVNWTITILQAIEGTLHGLKCFSQVIFVCNLARIRILQDFWLILVKEFLKSEKTIFLSRLFFNKEIHVLYIQKISDKYKGMIKIRSFFFLESYLCSAKWKAPTVTSVSSPFARRMQKKKKKKKKKMWLLFNHTSVYTLLSSAFISSTAKRNYNVYTA